MPDFSNRKPGRSALKSFWYLGLVGALLFCEPALAQKLVDPHAHLAGGRLMAAEDFRHACQGKALVRRESSEQIRQRECAHKADEAKVLPRDRTAHITRCLAEDGPTKTSAIAH